MNVRQTFIVYELVNRAGGVVYVGSTTAIQARLLDHRRKTWWRNVDHTRIHICAVRAEMLQLEAQLIARHRPKFNTYGNPDAQRRPRNAA